MYPKNISCCFCSQDILINIGVLCVACIGTTEKVEGGDQLPAGLGPLVVLCQSAWRRAGEMLENVD